MNKINHVLSLLKLSGGKIERKEGKRGLLFSDFILSAVKNEALILVAKRQPLEKALSQPVQVKGSKAQLNHLSAVGRTHSNDTFL